MEDRREEERSRADRAIYLLETGWFMVLDDPYRAHFTRDVARERGLELRLWRDSAERCLLRIRNEEWDDPEPSLADEVDDVYRRMAPKLLETLKAGEFLIQIDPAVSHFMHDFAKEQGLLIRMWTDNVGLCPLRIANPEWDDPPPLDYESHLFGWREEGEEPSFSIPAVYRRRVPDLEESLKAVLQKVDQIIESHRLGQALPDPEESGRASPVVDPEWKERFRAGVSQTMESYPWGYEWLEERQVKQIRGHLRILILTGVRKIQREGEARGEKISFVEAVRRL